MFTADLLCFPILTGEVQRVHPGLADRRWSDESARDAHDGGAHVMEEQVSSLNLFGSMNLH